VGIFGSGPHHLTLRSLITGMLVGSLLSLCNVYAGLKIGWSAHMGVASVLIAFAMWQLLARLGARRFGLLENNAAQAAASSAAIASSAGLVAPIPALALMTGRTLSYPWLAAWTLSVMALGVLMGTLLRRPMLEQQRLPFPYGVAAAQVLRELHGEGDPAASDVAKTRRQTAGLLASGIVAFGLTIAKKLLRWQPWSPSLFVPIGARTATLANLTLSLDVNLMMIGVGGLAGMRLGASMFFGAIVAWGCLAPIALARGWVAPGKATPTASWFEPLIAWLLWPGIGLLVASALTAFALSVPQLLRSFRAGRAEGGHSWSWQRVMLVLAVGSISVALQQVLFAVAVPIGALAVALAVGLAIVAARVNGETGVIPAGALGKVAQLALGALAPGSAGTNLMAANVTSGAAAHCGDVLQDFRTGEIVGARPATLVVSQIGGVVAGALAGSAAYLLLIPDPRGMLLSDAWPAPAAVQWKAVAELFRRGAAGMPRGALIALACGAACGVLLAVLERALAKDRQRWLPSAAGIGLAFVLPASNSLSVFLGALLAWLASRRGGAVKSLVAPVASGLIVGESLAGAVLAIRSML
jgi:uncharacterized oligopeptide transporter (OPT) family protein